MFKIDNKNTRATSDIFIVNFERISQLFLVFLLLTFNEQMLAVLGLNLLNVNILSAIFQSKQSACCLGFCQNL